MYIRNSNRKYIVCYF